MKPAPAATFASPNRGRFENHLLSFTTLNPYITLLKPEIPLKRGSSREKLGVKGEASA